MENINLSITNKSTLKRRSPLVVYVDENLKENAGFVPSTMLSMINDCIFRCSIIEEANVEAPTIEKVIFDQESVTDMNAVTTYVQDIFNYYKSREVY
jgi:hypothetical protein